MNSRTWALDLYDAGYQPVLAPLRAKRPNIAWKRYQTERVPRHQVEEWFSQGEHNIALISGAVSGTVVVDGDSADACGYIELITPETMKVLTSKGAHYYFRHPGGKVPNSVRVLDEPPIDLRGDGGLTIGPGSVHTSGHRYRLPDGADLVPVADLPVFNRDWFQLAEAKVQTFERPTLTIPTGDRRDAFTQARKYLGNVPGAIQGSGGDSHTYVQACRLVRGWNLTDSEALDLLAEWNAKCSPAWSEAELVEKVRHARAYGSGEFGSMLAAARCTQGFLSFGWAP
jgi:hypothetical protein